MDYVVTLDPPAVATGRTPLKLNEGPIRVDHAGIDWGDGAITAYMADQRWGSAPVDYRIPNRVVTIPLGLGMDDSSFIAARRQLTEKVALLQREGGWLQRGDTGWYADVVNATLTLPDKYGEGGGVEVDVKLVLECLPDFYGDEVALDAVTGTGQIHTVLEQSGAQAVIAGDHPARCRIIVTDTSGNDQQALPWGVRSRHYDPATTAALFYEAEALTPEDAAAVFAHAGASGGSTVKHASLATGWTPVLSTKLSASQLTHVGSYRVLARCWSDSATPQLRLVWGQGDLAHYVTNKAAQIAAAGGFYIVDLGTIRIDRQPVGATSWQGLIQGQAAVNGAPVEIDCLYLIPLDDGAGQLIASDQPPLLNTDSQGAGTGTDDASIGTVAWNDPADITTPGFVPVHAFIPGQAGILTVTDNRVRLVKAGAIQATDRADTSTPWQGISDPGEVKDYGSSADLWGGAWTQADINASGFGVAISANIGGTLTHYLVASDFGFAVPAGATIRGISASVNRNAIVSRSGGFFTGASVFYVQISVFFTLGGSGIVSQDAVVYANQIAEVRTDGMRRTPDGSAYGPVGQVFGDLPRLPPSGLEGRPVELFVRPSRGNLSTTADSGLDAFTVQARYRPCYLFGPT